ncbi:MAG: hypothetical protein MJ252_00645 [archaeon]|nr:hypothetical protein [archaeon]
MEFPRYKALFIMLCLLACLLAIGTILLPYAVRHSIMNKSQKKTKLDQDNSDLWGKFPGVLQTNLKHTFAFFDYSKVLKDPKEKLTLDKKISITESVTYQNFTKTEDQISFKVKRSFEKSENNEDKVTIPSLGFYEYLHTISNPSLYQKSIASLKYLTEFSDANEEKFEKQLFIKSNEDTFLGEEERIKNTFLQGVSEEKKSLVYSHEKYGFNKLHLIYKWVKLLGNEEEIKKALWLKNILKLNDVEIESVIGETSFLYKYYGEFKKKIEAEYVCEFTKCHLLYRQLADGSVLNQYNLNIKELISIMHPDQITFDSPEMNLFYEVDYVESQIPFEDIKLSGEQLFYLMDKNAENTLLNPKNIILLLGDKTNRILTDELKAKYFIKSLDQLDFISNYITKYLPLIYVYLKFENEEKSFYITGQAKTYVSLIQNYISNTYGKLYEKRDKISSIVLKKMLDSLWEHEDKESLCPEMLQRIIDDGKRVLKICNDEYFSFISEEGLKKWTRVYVCFREDGEKSDCDYEFLKEFMERGVLSQKEMEGIFSDDSLGFYFDLANKQMSESYGCEKLRCTGDELVTVQYTSSKITLNPPSSVKNISYTLKDWSPEDFPEPLELNYFQHEYNFTDEDCNEPFKIALSSLFTENKDFFNEQFKEGKGYINKNKLEIITTLFESGISSSKYSDEFSMKDMTNCFKFIQKIIQEKVIEGQVMNEYKLLSIIEGNNDEDKHYVELLSNGQYYNNYKPGITKTTGFNLKIDTNEDELEEYTFYTKNEDKENKILRKILKMNNKDFMNLKMNDYSPKEGKIISVDTPLFNFSPLTEEKKWISDGFEYPMNDELDTIYYYDELSTRKYQFDFSKRTTYQDIDCKRFNLNKDDLIQNLIEDNAPNRKDYPSSFQTFNKPFIVTTENKEFFYEIEKTNKENYICVDEFSNMVLNSQINLIYGMDTKGFGIFHSEVKEGIMPLISYSREYSVSKSSYEDAFSSVKNYKTGKTVIIALGIILTAIAFNLSIYFYLIHKKEEVGEPKEDEDPSLNKGRDSDNADVLLPKDFRNSDPPVDS